jgi:hypothetical protein
MHLSTPSCGWEQMKSEGSHGTPTMGELMKSVGHHDCCWKWKKSVNSHCGSVLLFVIKMVV